MAGRPAIGAPRAPSSCLRGRPSTRARAGSCQPSCPTPGTSCFFLGRTSYVATYRSPDLTRYIAYAAMHLARYLPISIAVNVYIPLSLYIYIYTCMCISLGMYLHTYRYTAIPCIYIYSHMYTHKYIHIHIWLGVLYVVCTAVYV